MAPSATRRTRPYRPVAVVIGLLLLFAGSVWNWLYNIPVQPNVEIRKPVSARWMIDASHPTEALIWNQGGPVSFYSLRTGELLFERRSASDYKIVPCPGDPRTTLIRRDGAPIVVDLRNDVVRSEIPSILPDSHIVSCQGGKTLVTHRDQRLQAFDAETGQLLWGRDDVFSFGGVWGGDADVVFATILSNMQIEGGPLIRRQNCHLLQASNGEIDPRFPKPISRSAWISFPPRFLIDRKQGRDGWVSQIQDLATGGVLMELKLPTPIAQPYFNAEGTELQLAYRQLPFGCRLARWDVKTGKPLAQLPAGSEIVNELVTDDGRYSVGEFSINFPPGYEAIRRGVAKIGIQLPAWTVRAPLLVDNQTDKVIGRLEYSTPINSVELSRTGDAFIQTCKDRIAVYFLPIQLNWRKRVFGLMLVIVSFVSTVIKIRPVLYLLAGNEKRPEKPLSRREKPTTD